MTMQLAVYLRVSTTQQAQAQTIEQQLTAIERHCRKQAWPWPPRCVRKPHPLRRTTPVGVDDPSQDIHPMGGPGPGRL
jgi:hypothetical protein